MCDRARAAGPAAVWVLLLAACAPDGPGLAPGAGDAPEVPRGYVRVLHVERDDRHYRFGPFRGYFFRPHDPGDPGRIVFLCFNEDGFYSSDRADGALLYRGEGRLAALPADAGAIPRGDARIRPVFFRDAPEAWLATRPEPRDEFVHFHSLHDAAGAVRIGYWLRHVAVAPFLYDMGGRVGPDSPLYHRTREGPDTGFARIVEFDRGPAGVG